MKRPRTGKAMVINRTTFEHQGHTYRLTGFYFTYVTSDNQRLFARVNVEDANSISGYGVAGCIVPIGEVKFLKRLSTYPLSDSPYRVDKDKYEFLKSLPQGLSSKEVEDKQMDAILDSILPSRNTSKA